MSEFCPECGTPRTGAFRFCRHCRFDFESADSTAGAAAPVASATVVPGPTSSRAPRVTGRRVAVAAIVVLIVGALANLGGPRPAALGGASGPPPGVALGSTNPASAVSSTPWATAKPGFSPTGETETAKVVRVVDGDTIVVALGGKNVKVRYIGMDTPEVVDPNSPVEPMGAEASAANKQLVAGKTVILEKDTSETDRYGRLLRYVWLRSGSTWTLVNLALVQGGFAEAVSYPPDTKYDDVLSGAQDSARTSLVGLWGGGADPNPTAKATVKATPRPTPRPTPKPTKRPSSSCHPSYSPCLPIVDDLDCPDVRAMGKAPVQVIGPDDYRLDRDGDGLGCE
jgi:micrococcal nuclease